MTVVALRCDGDHRVGAGHVARCLQIAAALDRRGCRTVLVGRYEDGAREMIAAAGAEHVGPAGSGPFGIPSDADFVVLDQYGIVAGQVSAAATELPVMVLVDQGTVPPGTTAVAYHGVAPPGAGEGDLIGPAYAPVAPRYVTARRPRSGARVLVTAGGGGVGDASRDAALALLDREGGFEVHVAARSRPASLPASWSWGWSSGGLLERVEWADLAISAAGSTPYELACAGLPTLLMVVAENQQRVACGFADAGLARAVDGREGVDVSELGELWRDTVARKRELAECGPAMIDGLGTARIADALLAILIGNKPAAPLVLRPAGTADRERLLAWRNDPASRAMSRSLDDIAPAEHRAWLERVLADPDRTLLVAQAEGGPAGSVRMDRHGTEAEISVVIDPGARGGGLGTRLIAHATELELASRPLLKRVVAEVRDDNAASLRAFERAGYEPTGQRGRGGGALLARCFD